MATRLYHPSDVVAPPNSPAVSATWTLSTGTFYRTMCSTVKRGSAMTTFSYSDADVSAQQICFAQFHTPLLTIGQTITSSQNLTGSVRCIETATGNNLFRTVGLRIMNGTSVQKILLAPTNGTVEVSATTLTSASKTNALAATNYTTVSGDYLVIEIGLGGDPSGGGSPSHSGSIRFGDGAASDLDFTDADTGDDNGWVQLVDTLTFIAPTVALTGTVTTATETDIVTGGKTVILTLSGASWITSGTLFDAQRQNIINGMDSAQAEAGGWDAKVKGLQGVAGVVRTSDTVCTTTLDAQAAYSITADETITVTVPDSAVATGVGAVASPTFVVTNVSAATENQEWITRLPREKSRSPQWSSY